MPLNKFKSVSNFWIRETKDCIKLTSFYFIDEVILLGLFLEGLDLSRGAFLGGKFLWHFLGGVRDGRCWIFYFFSRRGFFALIFREGFDFSRGYFGTGRFMSNFRIFFRERDIRFFSPTIRGRMGFRALFFYGGFDFLKGRFWEGNICRISGKQILLGVFSNILIVLEGARFLSWQYFSSGDHCRCYRRW